MSGHRVCLGEEGARGARARTLTAEEAAETKRLYGLYTAHQRGTLGKAEGSIKNVTSALKNALAYIGLPPWEWQPCDIDDWMNFRCLEGDLASSTQSQHITSLRGFQNYLVGDLSLANEYLQKFGHRPNIFITETNAIARKRKAHQRKKVITSLSADEANKLISEFDFQIALAHGQHLKSFNTLRRDKVMAFVLLSTGLRIDELVNIKLHHFMPDPKHPNFLDYAYVRVIGKGRKERTARIYNPQASQVIDWYIKSVRPVFLTEDSTDPSLLFLSERKGNLCTRQFGRSLSKVAEQAGIQKHVFPHLLRHTFATLWAERIGASEMQQQLGHANLSTTLGTYYHADIEAIGAQVALAIQETTNAIAQSVRDLDNENHALKSSSSRTG